MTERPGGNTPEEDASAGEPVSVELSPEQTVDRVVELQKSWSEYVNPRPREEIAELHSKGLLRIKKDQRGGIAATLCEVPLDHSKGDLEKGQMYHICGLATAGTPESRRALAKMLGELKEDMRRRGAGIITSTKNEVLAERLVELGLEEMSPSELLEKHPEYLDLFSADTEKRAGARRDRQYYLDQGDAKKFYVYVPQDEHRE